jgi:predicted Zn-dependent protease
LSVLKVKRGNELDADYFGIQYLYKSGYDSECFISFVQKVWPEDGSSMPAGTALSAVPPLKERLDALRQEISDILPKRDGAVTNTPEFADFHKRLEKLSYAAPETAAGSKPAPG